MAVPTDVLTLLCTATPATDCGHYILLKNLVQVLFSPRGQAWFVLFCSGGGRYPLGPCILPKQEQPSTKSPLGLFQMPGLLVSVVPLRQIRCLWTLKTPLPTCICLALPTFPTCVCFHSPPPVPGSPTSTFVPPLPRPGASRTYIWICHSSPPNPAGLTPIPYHPKLYWPPVPVPLLS